VGSEMATMKIRYPL